MDDLVLHVVTTLGVPGLTIYLIYKLLDRYAGKLVEHAGNFVAASTKQAEATTALIATVQDAGGKQHDVLLAVRAMSSELSSMKGWLQEVDAKLTSRKDHVA